VVVEKDLAMADTEKKFTLRLPEDMHAAISKMAEEDLRSLHSMVIVILRQAIEARQVQQQPPS
jgi:hypothetical protein